MDMEEALNVPRPRVNAALLPEFCGKYVTVVGNVDASKISAEGDAFGLVDGAGTTIQIALSSPLTDIIEGTVEVIGKVDNDQKVHGVMYRVFNTETQFNMELYNACMTLMHKFPECYG